MIQVFQYPHETLLQTSTPWTQDDSIAGYDDKEKFETDMIKLMLEERGMGLAANQIGITKRFFAIGHETFDTFQKHAIIWNPQVINFSEEKVINVEGCLSFKDIFVKVERPKKLKCNMKQHKEKQNSQNSTGWSPSASSMNSITLMVLRLIKEYRNYDGKWQTKDRKC